MKNTMDIKKDIISNEEQYIVKLLSDRTTILKINKKTEQRSKSNKNKNIGKI